MPKRGKSYAGKLTKKNAKTTAGKCSICKKKLQNLGAHVKRMHSSGNKPKP